MALTCLRMELKNEGNWRMETWQFAYRLYANRKEWQNKTGEIGGWRNHKETSGRLGMSPHADREMCNAISNTWQMPSYYNPNPIFLKPVMSRYVLDGHHAGITWWCLLSCFVLNCTCSCDACFRCHFFAKAEPETCDGKHPSWTKSHKR